MKIKLLLILLMMDLALNARIEISNRERGATDKKVNLRITKQQWAAIVSMCFISPLAVAVVYFTVALGKFNKNKHKMVWYGGGIEL